MYDLKVKLTFIESVLGLTPGDPEIYRSYIASKAPDAATTEDEVASLGVDKVVENGMTVFPREQGEPFFYDYQVKGFFKDTCGMLRRVPAYASSSLKNYKKVIDGLVFVFPRKIPVHYEGDIGLCERPLRASTPQGERVALAISEEIPAGATMEFTITCMDEKDLKLVREWLDYGYYRGLGQWRNSGKGKELIGEEEQRKREARHKEEKQRRGVAWQRKSNVKQCEGKAAPGSESCRTAKALHSLEHLGKGLARL